MTEWVTIKIPRNTRDAAKEDPRTYEEIMQAGLDKPTAKGMSIPSSVSKDEDPYGIIDEFVRKVEMTQGVDTERLARELAEKFDYAELSNQVAREITEELR